MQVRDGRSRGWFWLDNAVVDVFGAELGGSGFAVYAALARAADRDGRCFPSVSRLGESIGLKDRAVQGYLKQLAELGLIEVVPQYTEHGRNTSNLYRLLDVSEAVLRRVQRSAEPAVQCTPAGVHSDAPSGCSTVHPLPYEQDSSEQDCGGYAPAPAHARMHEAKLPEREPERLVTEPHRAEAERLLFQHQGAIFTFLRVLPTPSQHEALVGNLELQLAAGRTISAEEIARAVRQARAWTQAEQGRRPSPAVFARALADVLDPAPVAEGAIVPAGPQRQPGRRLATGRDARAGRLYEDETIGEQVARLLAEREANHVAE